MVAGAAYNPWENRRVSGRYNGTAFKPTFGSQYGIYGGFDFELIGNYTAGDELEHLSWGVVTVDVNGNFIFKIVGLNYVAAHTPSGSGLVAFRMRIYLKGLGDSIVLVNPSENPIDSSQFARNRGWTVSYSQFMTSSAQTRIFVYYDDVSDSFYSYSYTVPKNTSYISVYAVMDTAQAPSAVFTEYFQVAPGYTQVNANESTYLNAFGSGIGNFFTVTSGLWNSHFGVLLSVFVGGCIIALFIKMGVSL